MASLRSLRKTSTLFDLQGSMSFLAFLTESNSRSGNESAYDVLLDVVVGLVVDGLVEVDVTVLVEASKLACGIDGRSLLEDPPL